MHRHDYVKKISEIFKQKRINKLTYSKSDEQIYEALNQNKGVERAIANARKRMDDFDPKDKFSDFIPGTMVHELVDELLRYMKE